ncbi:MAG: DUF3108 domain-containing protein [Pseudomonadales bacterium]|jgi:hypothetical protein|nr:hypothetical protein [Gammaproteobacteria bacterium]MDP6024485.1 DUF3108 domain-containing protein [Pseudomonadales bacterium]MDP6316902.1 DUF3108 domain-containing protein [Pseudomonadales bacterium]MDP7313863.1 DUF3108 domain-containing protein [Pseudomonadales bacterium]MDP7576398.1 DUF3108 domain-containing protein [Pseudomonadales bacterium]|tara:strand:+ start:579 stop:1292 length:714 start_codon:yes stop_codon:yes gene_type:complete
MRLVTTIILVFLVISSLAKAEPTLFRAVYRADYRGLPISAEGIRELRKDENGIYTLSSTANSFFASITEFSRFKIKDDLVVPVEYQYHRSGIGKKRDAVLSFDWDKMLVLNDLQSPPWEMAIPEGTLDKLLYQLKVREDLLAAHQQGLPWPELHYQIADGGKLKHYEFKVIGEEEIETPIGVFSTIKATRIKHRPKRNTTFWLAPEYDFLLVRFQQVEDDRGFELLLKEAEFDGIKL